MKREFLSNFKVGDASLPDVVIDAIMTEHQRGLDAATTHPEGNGATGGKMFTQDELNRIVSERLAREKTKAEPPQVDEREQALKAREARLDCRDYLDSKKYPVALLDILDSTDTDKFKALSDKLMGAFPGMDDRPIPPPYAAGTGTTRLLYQDTAVSEAFKPPKF